MKHGLILIDIQNNYFTGGKMAIVGIDKAANNANREVWLARAKRHYIPGHVWHITHRCHKKRVSFEICKGNYK